MIFPNFGNSIFFTLAKNENKIDIMKFRILIIFLLVSAFCYSNDKEIFWGQTGHRVIGEIAYKNLTKKAKRNLEKLLKNEGLALISTYADEIRSDRKYSKFGPWHYVNFKDEETYEASEKNPNGDLIAGIGKCQKIISDSNASKEDKVFYLKLLVHLIGDLHQPLHAGRGKDRGGNSIRLKWFRANTNLHSVWDTRMIESYGMTYTELTSNLNKFSKQEIKTIQKGSVLDWVKETRIITMKVYNSVKADENLSYRYMYDHFGTVKEQLQKGGLRLAKVLNDLFG